MHNSTYAHFPLGYLLISVCPNNARFYLDDKQLNNSGDSCNLSLRQGTYKLIANINGYRQFSENVTVDLNSYTIINITMVKNSSLLQNPSFLILLFGTIGGAAIVLTIYLAKRRRNWHRYLKLQKEEVRDDVRLDIQWMVYSLLEITYDLWS